MAIHTFIDALAKGAAAHHAWVSHGIGAVATKGGVLATVGTAAATPVLVPLLLGATTVTALYLIEKEFNK